MMYWIDLLTRFLKSALCTLSAVMHMVLQNAGVADRVIWVGDCSEQWWLELGVLGLISGITAGFSLSSVFAS